MFITGLGIAAPARRYSQAECWEVLQKSQRFHSLTPRAQALLRKVLTGDNGIVNRHLVLENLEQAFELTPDTLHARFRSHAPLLATEAAQKALQDAGKKPHQVDALLISTCTGYMCPGLTSYVSEGLGLRQDALTLDLVGQGCGAALPNLRTAEALLAAGRCQCVLSVCVEVCSAALYFDNDPGVLISACLFGDGAAAVVLAPQPQARRRVEWKSMATRLQPADRDLLRMEQKEGMLRNILRPQVPVRAAQSAQRVLEEVLAGAQVARSHITGWVMHPGGRDVLLALRDQLGVSAHDLRWSQAVLREYGNLSSPSVLFVLQAALADSTPSGYWWMSSFGAGFSCHGALLKID